MSVEEPGLARRELGRRLRRLRHAADLTQEDAAPQADITVPTLRRIETGRTGVKKGNVLALCSVYGTDEATTDALVALAKNTHGKGLWEDSSVVPDWFGLYLGLEHGAQQIELWAPEIVPGLLQTREYARAVLATDPQADPGTVEHRVALRSRRQATVLRQARVTALLSEGALSLQVGSPKIVASQVEHLRDVADRDNVYVGVVPWTAGPRQAQHPFNILSFDGMQDPDVTYVELQTGALYLEKAGELVTYRQSFAWLYEQSVPVKEYTS